MSDHKQNTANIKASSYAEHDICDIRNVYAALFLTNRKLLCFYCLSTLVVCSGTPGSEEGCRVDARALLCDGVDLMDKYKEDSVHSIIQFT